MSLINDALKKARATQPRHGALGAGPLRAVAHMADGPALKPRSARRGRGKSVLTLPLILVVVLVFALGGGLLWAWYRADSGEMVARAKTESPATASPAPKAIVAPEVSLAPTPVPPPPMIVVSHAPVLSRGEIISQIPPATPTVTADAPVHQPLVTMQAEVAPGPVHRAIVHLNANTPKPAAREYKLEGIFFSPKGPSAVIDGQMVSVGSDVEDGKVVAIDNESATVLTTSGETNVLVLIR
jgi:hypothetical protein